MRGGRLCTTFNVPLSLSEWRASPQVNDLTIFYRGEKGGIVLGLPNLPPAAYQTIFKFLQGQEWQRSPITVSIPPSPYQT